MYDAMDIAKYVINVCTLKGKPISNIQLQKILYYIQINFYRVLGKRAFRNIIEAWQYGPVVPEVYDTYKRYGSGKICKIYEGSGNQLSGEERRVIDRVIRVCTSIGPWELVERSHKVNGPWDLAYRENETEIQDDAIRAYAMRV